MLSGFNTNYRYRGVLFHVQTEDSGVANPHVITHLFHGGNILASEKFDYTKKLDSDDLEGVVRKLMESQHKAMLKSLKRGGFDAVILERIGPSALDGNPDASDTMSALPPEDPAVEPPDASQGPQSSTPQEPQSSTPQERLDRAFGEAVVGQKPLDEVVLEYLVSNARKRKRRPQ
jgi:hypothetical protein